MSSTEQLIQQLLERKIFDRDDLITLLRSVFAEEEGDVSDFVVKLYSWAEGVRTQEQVLKMILDGLLLVTFDKAGEMAVTLSPLARDVQTAMENSNKQAH